MKNSRIKIKQSRKANNKRKQLNKQNEIKSVQVSVQDTSTIPNRVWNTMDSGVMHGLVLPSKRGPVYPVTVVDVSKMTWDEFYRDYISK